MPALSIQTLWNSSGLPCALLAAQDQSSQFSDLVDFATGAIESWLPSLRAPVYLRLSKRSWIQIAEGCFDGTITAADAEIFSHFRLISPEGAWGFHGAQGAFDAFASAGFKVVLGQMRLDKPAVAMVSKCVGAELSCALLPPDVCKGLAQRLAAGGKKALITDIPSPKLALDCSRETSAILSGPSLFKRRGASPPPKIEAASAKALRLLGMVNGNADISLIEDEIKQDAACSYKLISMINSAGLKSQKAVSTIHDAIMQLGYAKLGQWLALLALSSTNKNAGSPALRFAICLRAKTAELLASRINGPKASEAAFSVALFSGMDALFDRAMEDVCLGAGLNLEATAALLENVGPSADALALAKSFEDDPESAAGALASMGLSSRDALKILHQAISWSLLFQTFASD